MQAAAGAAPWWAAASDRSLWIKRLDGADQVPGGGLAPNGVLARFLTADRLDPAGYDVLCYALRDAHATAHGRGWVAMAPALLQVAWEVQQVVWAEGLRVPLVSHSGYRATATNVEVGGAVNSEHIAGAALDFHVPGMPLARVRDLVLKAPGRGGVGYYPRGVAGSDAGWIHVDVGDRVTWEG